MTTTLAPPSSALYEPSAPHMNEPAARHLSPDDQPSRVDEHGRRGRQLRQSSRSTFLSSPSPSPNARSARGPLNPVQYPRQPSHDLKQPPWDHCPQQPRPQHHPPLYNLPQPARSQPVRPQQDSKSQTPRPQDSHPQEHTLQSHRPQDSRSNPRPQQKDPGLSRSKSSKSTAHGSLPPSVYPGNNRKALARPDLAPIRLSATPKRRRRSSSLNNSCMSRSDVGCMSALVGRSSNKPNNKPGNRPRSTSARGRSRTRPEERNSLLENFRGYEREDSPRTTVSKRMSDLGLIDAKPQHTRDPSNFSTGSNVAAATIDEEAELDAKHAHIHKQTIMHTKQNSQTSSQPRSVAHSANHSANLSISHGHSVNHSINHSKRSIDEYVSRKPNNMSQPSSHKRNASSRAGYSLFPAADESPVSPISPISTESPGLPPMDISPKRRKRSPSPPLGPRPLSPSRKQSMVTTSNFSRKTTAAVPKNARRNSRRRTASPPLSAGAEDPLVWHDSEITGHLMLDPEDDGTGINGVGFKPTKTEEEARRMKRKQQVEAWKAREGKADRDERSRRRQASDAEQPTFPDNADVPDDEDTRIVRFAEG